MAAAPFIPLRPYMTFNNSIAFNSFGPGTSLAPDAIRSPDARSDPGLPTDQSLAPPVMPARADSRPDFIRGFGLDVPEEAEEEQESDPETEPDEQAVTEVHEEEPLLAEVSHIAVTGADDTIDMDLEEADAEVGDITTAAQSRIHSRHVSRLSAALSLRSVGGLTDYPEPEVEHDEQGEREIDLEDDEIGEWTGSEDLRTPTEFTEDEVRKIPCRVASTRPSSALTIYLIMSAFAPFLTPFHLDSFFCLPPLFLYVLVSAFRRASESGRTHLTRSVRANNVNNAVLCVVLINNNNKIRSRFPAVSQISRTHH